MEAARARGGDKDKVAPEATAAAEAAATAAAVYAPPCTAIDATAAGTPDAAAAADTDAARAPPGGRPPCDGFGGSGCCEATLEATWARATEPSACLTLAVADSSSGGRVTLGANDDDDDDAVLDEFDDAAV